MRCALQFEAGCDDEAAQRGGAKIGRARALPLLWYHQMFSLWSVANPLHGENLKPVPGSRLSPCGAACRRLVLAEQAGGVKRGGVGGGSALLPASQCAANAERRAFCERKH
jgi:hypothetical protein